MTRRDRPAPGASPVVLFVGGSGRSGSTLLERLLGELPHVVPLGEVVHLWQRGVIDDELCACGDRFSGCPFWTKVGQQAFGGWDRTDAQRVLDLKRRVDRQRHLPVLARRRAPEQFDSLVHEYSHYYHCIYQAVAKISGAHVVVDSSKHASTALALSHDDSVDMRTVQIVRDPRGVAFSWAKSVGRPETADGLMPQYSAAKSTALWMVQNLALDAIRYRGGPLTRIRYEDLVGDPRRLVSQVWADLGLPGVAHLAVHDRTVNLGRTHSVAGNPMRFTTGPVRLSADATWKREMPRRERALVTAMSAPLLARFGYLGSSR